jgi:hypothetical protein
LNKFKDSYQVLALLKIQVLCHYTIPLKSNFSGMGFVPFHHTLTIMNKNVTTPPS